MLYFSCLILITTLIAESVMSTPFLNCSQGLPPAEVRIDYCSSHPCTAILGFNATGQIDFTVSNYTEKLKPTATAWAYRVPLEIPIPQEDGCETLTSGKCPLKAGDRVTYAFSMLISEEDYSAYVGIEAEVEFSFLDANNEVVVCARVPVILQDYTLNNLLVKMSVLTIDFVKNTLDAAKKK